MASAWGAPELAMGEELAVVQVQHGQVDEAAPDRALPRQQAGLAGLQRAEQLVETHHPVPTVGDPGVALDALVEWDALLLQPAEPVLADELAVGQQGGDPRRAEDGAEAFHQGDPLGGVEVARLAQDAPGFWRGGMPGIAPGFKRRARSVPAPPRAGKGMVCTACGSHMNSAGSREIR